MKAYDQTEEFQRIQQYYASLKHTPAKIREGELPVLEAIMKHKDFKKIVSAFTAIQDYFGCVLNTADKHFISLKLAEMDSKREEDQLLQKKMKESIKKLEEIITALSEQNSLLFQKFKWLEGEINRYQASLTDIQEEIDIIQSQNQKLKTNTKNSSGSEGDKQELKQILSYYRCNDRPFPKNKTEALMLVNRIESMIQQLEMKRLSSYLLN